MPSMEGCWDLKAGANVMKQMLVQMNVLQRTFEPTREHPTQSTLSYRRQHMQQQ